MQRCPVEKYAPCTATFTAVGRSASSSTTSGFLLPISSWNLAIREIAFCAIARPVSIEPVKLNAATSGWLTRVSPTTEPEPITRLNTPGGTPASARMSASAHAQPGVHCAGLKTTVLPKASAGAIFHAGMAIGKIPGRNQSDDANRLSRDFDVDPRTDRRNLFTREAEHFAGKELEDVARAHRFADALRQRLAFFARQQPADVVFAREDVRTDLVEDVGALLDRSDRPGGEGSFGGVDRGDRLAFIGERVLADDVAQIGRVPIGGPSGSGKPFAVDVVLKSICHR